MGHCSVSYKHKIISIIILLLVFLQVVIYNASHALQYNLMAQIANPNAGTAVIVAPPSDSANVYIVKFTVSGDLEDVWKYSSAGALLSSINLGGKLDIQEEVDSTTVGDFYNISSETNVSTANTRPVSGADYTCCWSGNNAGAGRPGWQSGYKYLRVNGGAENVGKGAMLSDNTYRLYISTRRYIGAFDISGNETSRAASFGVSTNTFSGLDYVLATGAVPGQVNELRSDVSGLAVSTISPTGTWVYLFNSSGGIQLILSGFGSSTISGLAMTTSKVIVADRGNNKVKIFNRATGILISEFGTVGAGIGQFAALGIVGLDADDNYIYVVDNGNDMVDVFDHVGTYITRITGIPNPANIRITTTKLYVYNSNNTGAPTDREIYTYDRTTTPPTLIGIFLDLDVENKSLQHMWVADN